MGILVNKLNAQYKILIVHYLKKWYENSRFIFYKYPIINVKINIILKYYKNFV